MPFSRSTRRTISVKKTSIRRTKYRLIIKLITQMYETLSNHDICRLIRFVSSFEVGGL
jgi:hypothetical protein